MQFPEQPVFLLGEEKDYTIWLAHSTDPGDYGDGCILGYKEQYLRLRKSSVCQNGRDYVVTKQPSVCPCSLEDFLWYQHPSDRSPGPANLRPSPASIQPPTQPIPCSLSRHQLRRAVEACKAWAWPPPCLGPSPFPDSPSSPQSWGGPCRGLLLYPTSHHHSTAVPVAVEVQGLCLTVGSLEADPRPSLAAHRVPLGCGLIFGGVDS